MKQLVILSGKGGTGKTSLAASFAHLAHAAGIRAVLADADVDAANLELVLQPHRLEEHEFIGGAVAVIDKELCCDCGICESVCRFEAVIAPNSTRGNHYQIDPIACEGCAACVHQCPEAAIHLEPQLAGYWFRSDTRYGPLVHAALRPAQENSGKLVTIVRQQARLLGLDNAAQIVLVDGPPGIGCPVISAVSGADLVLIVAEPTVSGIHDMERVLSLTRHFNIPTLVCINKADIYPPGSKQIEDFCRRDKVVVVGRLPFDELVTEAMIQGEPVTVYRPDTPASQSVVKIWNRVSRHLLRKDGSP